MSSALREGNTPPPRRSRPDVWLVPMGRNSRFFGRDEVLDAIRRGLLSQSRATITEAELSLKGLGKTQLALEYVHRHAGDYRIVLWANAELPGVIAAEYAKMAAALNLPERSLGDQRAQVEAVHRWLSHNNGWILVLEDVSESIELERFVPHESAGHVLLTVPASQQIAQGCRLVIGPVEPRDATEFLATRSGLKEDEQAARLTNRLGNIPLALELAGAYVAQTGLSFSALEDMVNQRLPAAVREEGCHPDSKCLVTALLGVTLERLAAESPAALDLLALSAFLGANDIFPSLLRDGATFLLPRLSKTVADDAMFEAVATTLLKYGLASSTGDSLSFHPLVQTITREALNKEQRSAWAEAALRVVASAFPVESYYAHVLPACSRLLSHVYSATRHAEELGVAREETGFLLNQVGLYLRGCREYKAARDCYRRAVALGKAFFGENHGTVATRFNNLGVVHQEIGEFDQARACYEKAAEICEAVNGSPHETVTKPLRNLCHLFELTGDYNAARDVYRRIISIYIELGGWNHPTVPECFNSLGIMFHKQKRFFNARECFERAITAEESAKVPRKEHLTHYLNNLGTVFQDEGRPRKAQKLFERALDMERELYGDNHMSVAITLTCLGHAHRAQKRYSDARKCLEESLMIHEAQPEANQHFLSRALGQLGKTLRSLGEPAKARACFERLLAIDERGLPPNAPSLIKDLVDLGLTLEDLELHADAQQCYERALALEEENFGSKHEHAATVLTFIGRTLQAQGKAREALGRVQRALVIDTEGEGKNSPSVARDALHIGLILTDLGDNAGALGHFMRAQEIYESTLGYEHPKTREVRDRLDALASITS